MTKLLIWMQSIAYLMRKARPWVIALMTGFLILSFIIPSAKMGLVFGAICCFSFLSFSWFFNVVIRDVHRDAEDDDPDRKKLQAHERLSQHEEDELILREGVREHFRSMTKIEKREFFLRQLDQYPNVGPSYYEVVTGMTTDYGWSLYANAAKEWVKIGLGSLHKSKNKQSEDEKFRLYAAVIHEMQTGHPPFRFDDESEFAGIVLERIASLRAGTH